MFTIDRHYFWSTVATRPWSTVDTVHCGPVRVTTVDRVYEAGLTRDAYR